MIDQKKNKFILFLGTLITFCAIELVCGSNRSIILNTNIFVLRNHRNLNLLTPESISTQEYSFI